MFKLFCKHTYVLINQLVKMFFELLKSNWIKAGKIVRGGK